MDRMQDMQGTQDFTQQATTNQSTSQTTGSNNQPSTVESTDSAVENNHQPVEESFQPVETNIQPEGDPDDDLENTPIDGEPCTRSEFARRLGDISAAGVSKICKSVIEKFNPKEDLYDNQNRLTVFAQQEILEYRQDGKAYRQNRQPIEQGTSNQASNNGFGGAMVPSYQSNAKPQSALDRIQNFGGNNTQGNRGAITPEIVVERFDQQQQQNFSEGQNALAQLQQMDEYLQSLDNASFQAEYQAALADGWKRRLALEEAKKRGDMLAYQQLYGNVGNNSADNCQQGNGNGNNQQ